MNTVLGTLIAAAMLSACVLAVLLNPGLGVLAVLLAILAGIYAFRNASGKAVRARRKRRRKEQR